MMELDIYPFLDREYFSTKIKDVAATYNQADPFPHVVIDDFLPEDIAQKIADSFPKPNLTSFEQPDNAFQKNKLGRTQANDFLGVPNYIRHFLTDMNNMVMVDWLEAVTSIQGIIPDPHFQGGALHQILPGGKLAIHADFNMHPKLKLDRRLNVLIYFNRSWEESYGGHLELWDKDMTTCKSRILPIFNRCVIFNTTSTSYHGHPNPLTCPPDRTRNSIALYYYTNGRPDDEKNAKHSTLWQERPDGP